MKSLTEHLWFETPHRRDYLNITDTVAQLVRKSGVQEGLCLVNAMHITASVYINDAEDGLLHDYDAWLEKLAPPITRVAVKITRSHAGFARRTLSAATGASSSSS